MARVSKTNLKNAVRECLIEILEEGLSGQPGQVTLNESRAGLTTMTGNSKDRTPRRSSVYDKIAHADPQRESRSSHQSERLDRIAESAKAMTDDPVLSGIFADTARTTLQEQVRAESGKPASPASGGDAAANKSYKSDPSELFGAESAGKWAQLAFADPVKK